MTPAVEDMVRDIRDRMAMFGVNLTVNKVALTFQQVKEYNLLPNPAKTNGYPGQRALYPKVWVTKVGNLDALPPDVLHQMIEKQFLKSWTLRPLKKNYSGKKNKPTKEILTGLVDNIIQGKLLTPIKLGRLNH